MSGSTLQTERSIPFVGLGQDHAPLVAELREAFDRVLATSGFMLGPEVDAFEAEFAAYCQVDHCVGVSSGTAALEIAFRALGIGPGDEVIVPAHTFIASALGVIRAGATPVFCDVDERTGLIDSASARSVIGTRTAAILAVHLYGQVCDMDALGELADRHSLAIVEDAAQAHGATFRERPAGSFGAAAAFSFYPSKNLGALGDGGAVCTSDPDVDARVRRLRNLGQESKGEHVELGYNDRLDGLQAALLRVKLRRLDSWNAARRRHAHAYGTGLSSAVRQVVEDPRGRGVYHLYPIRVEDRDDLAAELNGHGVATGVHYSPAVHEQPPIAELAQPRTSLEVAEAWAREELSLPIFAELDASDLARVIEITNAWATTR